MKIEYWLFIIFSGVVVSCSLTDEIENNYWLKSVGNRTSIIKNGELKGIVNLNKLRNFETLYGLGPIDGLKGEVTIYDGNPYIAVIDKNDKPKIEKTWNKKAIFLAYGASSSWRKVILNDDLIGLEEVERFVKMTAREIGLDLEKGFIFRIEGKVNRMVYHIIFKKDFKKHNKKEHQKAKRKFIVENKGIKAIGVWSSPKGEGVYTHPGKRTHLHFISKDKNDSGHIDSIKIGKGVAFFFPK